MEQLEETADTGDYCCLLPFNIHIFQLFLERIHGVRVGVDNGLVLKVFSLDKQILLYNSTAQVNTLTLS